MLHSASARLRAMGTPKALATDRMIWIAFFYLMRPGAFCYAGDSSHPFRFKDGALKFGHRVLDNRRATEAQLRAATFSVITFDDQKSGVRGEKVGHGRSGTSMACPTQSLAKQIITLRRAGARDCTPLGSYQPAPGAPLVQLTSRDFTDALRMEAVLTGHKYGISPSDVSVGCFCTTGAMALFAAGVDSTRIRLLGRWNSWAMLRYLHLQSGRIMGGFAKKMLSGGGFDNLSTNPPPDQPPEAPDAPPVIVPNADE